MLIHVIASCQTNAHAQIRASVSQGDTWHCTSYSFPPMTQCEDYWHMWVDTFTCMALGFGRKSYCIYHINRVQCKPTR